MNFIILATAATLFKAGHTNIQSAADAAQALRPLAGRGAEILLAVGLIGTGFLAVPILTGSSAYAVTEAFKGRYGFRPPPLLMVIMLIANNRKVMKDRVNGLWTNIFGWSATLVMFVAAVALVLTWN